MEMSSNRLSVASSRQSLRALAFTLVELMISLAMMVVLMLAVNYIFSSVGKATSTAQTVSSVNRDAQAAATVMYNDFADIALDGPYLEIHSERLAAFRTKQDELSTPGYIPGSTPAVTDGSIRVVTTTGSSTDNVTIPKPILGDRNFRLDYISFFARGTFPRQTGNDGQFVANQSSSEALIWYGHLKLPDNSSTNYFAPGTDANNTSPVQTAQKNPNNFYATQWILGRKVILLIPETPKPAGSVGAGSGVWDNSSPPVYQVYHQRSPTASPTSLGPLAQGLESRDSAGTGFQIQQSRYDVAGTNIAQFKTILASVVTANPTGWWNGNNIDYRFWANPFISRPLSSSSTALTVPTLIHGCSNFVVEFAGDFVNQDPATGNILNWYGDPTVTPPNAKTDGQIDYFYNSTTKTRAIRWYGFPRSVTGQSSISLSNGDVVPLRDTLQSFSPSAISIFERQFPSSAVQTDYTANGAILINGAYICAWGPDTDTLKEPKPTLIRMVFTVDDPNNNLGNGVTYEYVFKVQQ